MQHDENLLKSIGAIYKYVFSNDKTHRNIIRKKLILQGKISSKGKFFEILDFLLKSGNLTMEKELVSINKDLIQIGVLQKERAGCYVVTPHSRKRYKIDRSIAASYKTGDLLDLVIEKVGDTHHAIVLCKSEKDTEFKNALKEDKLIKERAKNSQEINNDTKEKSKGKENLILGRVIKTSHDKLVFIPNKKSFEIRQIPILNEKSELASFQDKICIMELENLEVPYFGGKIVQVKGDAGNPIHEYDAIAESYGAIMNWRGVELEKEISQIPVRVNTQELDLISEAEASGGGQEGKVIDLRHLPFATIDPANCKDMDDAIYSAFNENGDIVCYTAVANVTKYVDLNSEIGQKYIEGAFTIYAPNKAYNILPTQLSTGICSLNPYEDRLAFVIKTTIDRFTGRVKDSNIYDAIIQSKNKYSYEQAQEIVDRIEEDTPKSYLFSKFYNKKELTDEEQILMNYYAAQSIKRGFENRKMIRFTANKEREIIFDDSYQQVVDIAPVPHLQYHEVIEDFMIMANETTAKYAKDNKLGNIYRVHDAPNFRKVERANEFFDILGINFDGDFSAEGIRSLLELIRNTADEETINKFLIKMQSRAVYSDQLYSGGSEEEMGQRISHYALQSPHYSHTTSPIRRLPDFITQYNILANIHGEEPINPKVIKKIVETANNRQLEVDQAEKDFEDISSVLYCEQHIGEKMTGRITKIRQASSEEGFEDSIIVIAKDDERGINVEIPLSQILGRPCYDCELSKQKCAVYDGRGNTVLTVCKPIDFIIEKADRKAMVVTGRTTHEMFRAAEKRDAQNKNYYRLKNKNGKIKSNQNSEVNNSDEDLNK